MGQTRLRFVSMTEDRCEQFTHKLMRVCIQTKEGQKTTWKKKKRKRKTELATTQQTKHIKTNS